MNKVLLYIGNLNSLKKGLSTSMNDVFGQCYVLSFLTFMDDVMYSFIVYKAT